MSFVSEDSPLRKLFVPNPTTERAKATKFDINRAGTQLLYCVGTNVIVKDLEDPTKNEVYTQHGARTTAARFAPNGHYIASGDERGNVRVWASDHPERLLKLETRALGGPVRDLAWDSESKRIIAVGSGATMCKAFLWDTGNSMGDMVGHTKEVNSVAIRPTRPFKAVTGGEDYKVVFYNGPPFKFGRSHTGHTNFVNCVAFAPDGSRFATVSSDRRGLLFDGKTGDPVGELEGGHAGGIYAVAFSPDSARVLTASGDKTCRVWDASTGALVTSIAMRDAPELGDMQCGVAWGAARAVSLSLSGDLNVLALDGGAPTALQGPQAATTAVAVHAGTGDAVVGCADGTAFVYRGDVVTKIGGAGHSSKCTGVAVCGDRLFSVGFDDTLRSAPLASLEYDVAEAVEGQPAAVAASGADAGVVAVATSKGVALVRGADLVSFTPVSPDPTAVAVSADGARVAVAVGGEAPAIRVFAVSGSDLSQEASVDGCPAVVHALAFSPDGTKLAAGDAGREVRVWDAASLAPIIEYTWIAHGSRVTSVAWKADSDHVVSGSVDGNVIVWQVSAPKNRSIAQQAHARGVLGVAARPDNAVVSVGMDACVKEWAL